MIMKELSAVILATMLLAGALVVIAPSHASATPTVLFSDDFEGGDLSSWSAVTNAALSTDQAVSPTHSCKFIDGHMEAAVNTGFPCQAQVSFYIPSTGTPTFATIFESFMVDDSSYIGAYVIEQIHDGDCYLQAAYISGGWHYDDICIITKDAWHTIFINEISDISYELWYDGVQQGTTWTGINYFGDSNIYNAYVGSTWNMYIDDYYWWTGQSDPAPPPAIIYSNGPNLEINGTRIILKGINDQTVIPLNFYPYPAFNYRYHNHLFPNYTGDLTTKLPSDNYTDFWWQYFWLVQDLGLNCVRLGAFSDWGLDWMHRTWCNDRALWDSIIDPMFAMAEANGVYLIFNFGGDNNASGRFDRVSNGFGWGQSDPTNGNIYEVGSETYGVFVNWSGEVMRHYQNETSLAMWEIWNEPDNDALYLNYWSLLPDPDSAWYNWSHNVSDDFKAQDDHHLIINGFESGLFYGWGQGNFNALNNNSVDASIIHFYGDAEDDYLVYWRDNWSDALNKPLFFDEAGLSMSAPPWTISYWLWLDAECTAYNVSVAWLTLIDHPGYPISPEVMASIPPVPGYIPPPIIWAPSFTSSPILSVYNGSDYNYTVTLNESVILNLSTVAGWLTLTHEGTNITPYELHGVGTPIGNYTMNLSAYSELGTLTAWQNFSIEVFPAIPPPPPDNSTVIMGSLSNDSILWNGSTYAHGDLTWAINGTLIGGATIYLAVFAPNETFMGMVSFQTNDSGENDIGIWFNNATMAIIHNGPEAHGDYHILVFLAPYNGYGESNLLNLTLSMRAPHPGPMPLNYGFVWILLAALMIPIGMALRWLNVKRKDGDD